MRKCRWWFGGVNGTKCGESTSYAQQKPPPTKTTPNKKKELYNWRKKKGDTWPRQYSLKSRMEGMRKTPSTVTLLFNLGDLLVSLLLKEGVFFMVDGNKKRKWGYEGGVQRGRVGLGVGCEETKKQKGGWFRFFFVKDLCQKWREFLLCRDLAEFGAHFPM